MRKWWKARLEKARNFKYVLGVLNQRVEAVYEVDFWKQSDQINRIEFVGHDAPNEIASQFLHKKIPYRFRKFGMASPFLYSTMKNKNEEEANNMFETNAEYHQKNFWEFLEWKLQESGNPFTIKLCYSNGKPRHWAHIAKVKGINEDINFLSQSGILRICLYIYDRPGLYELIKEKRDLLEQALGYPVAFEVGGKNNNVQWIKREWSFIPNNEDDYKKVCEQAIPEMLKFIEAFKPYM